MRAALALAAATFVTAAILGVVLGPSPLTGDETEYYSMACAFATNGNPTLTPTVVSTILSAFPGYPAPSWDKAVDGTYDALHFWLLSFLASPFFLLCKAVGLNWRHCFVFLNAISLAAAVGVTSYYFQLRGGVLLLIGLCTSPLLPFLNKAHGEAFSVSLLTIAVVFLARRKPLAAALTTSFISAQISAFSPLAAILLVYWAHGLWTERRRPTRWELAIVTVCGCLLVLQPFWTFWRHRTFNLIYTRGFVRPELLDLRRVSGILIDPDAGLLFAWPPAAVLALLTIIGLWRNPDLLRKRLAFWVFVVGATIYVGVVGAQQTNYIGTLRYSFWFLPFCLIGLLLVYEQERTRGAGHFATVIAIVCVAGSAATFTYMAKTGFQPLLKRRPLAELWYRYLPAAYDPVMQSFADLTLNDQRAYSYSLFLTGRYPINEMPYPHIWGLSNEACTKLLVFAYAFTSSNVPPRLPFGCTEAIDPAQLLRYVRSVGGSAMRDRFVSIPRHDLDRMRLPRFPAPPAIPANRAPRVDSIATPARNSSEVTYVLRVSDPDGWQDIDSVFLTIGGPHGEPTPESACQVVYNQPRGELNIAKPLGKVPALPSGSRARPVAIPGRPGLLRGEHCGINPENVTVDAVGDSITLTVPVALDSVLAAPGAQVQTGVMDFAQVRSGSTQASYLFAPPRNAPGDLTLDATGQEGAFKVTVHPSADYRDISHVWVLIGEITVGSGCYIGVEPKTRMIYLTPDDPASGPAGAMRMGDAGFLENGQCKLDGRNSAVVAGPAGLELDLRVERKKRFSAPKRVWASYQDDVGKTRAWREIGAL